MSLSFTVENEKTFVFRNTNKPDEKFIKLKEVGEDFEELIFPRKIDVEGFDAFHDFCKTFLDRYQTKDPTVSKENLEQ